MTPPPRLGRWIGLLGVALAVSGAATFLLAPIRMPDEALALQEHLADHRTLLIAVAVLSVGGNTLMAAFFIGLAFLLEEDPMRRLLGRIGAAGMLIQITAVCIAFSLIGVAAWRGPSPEVAQGLTDAAWAMINLAAGPCTAVAIAAFGLALRGRPGFGAWILPVSAFAAVAHLVVSAAFARHGFLAPQGDVAIVVPLVYLAWIGAVGAALSRS